MSNGEKIHRFVGINANAIQGPLVMFIGPKAIGKTAALVRLSSYLQLHGYQVKANPALKPAEDSYQDQIDKFHSYLNNPNQIPFANQSEARDFLLLDVFHSGRLVCQFLEAPGEDFFNINNPQSQNFEPYFQNILMSQFKKIFVFFYEYNMFNNHPNAQILINNYGNRLSNIISQLNPNFDKVGLVMNKIDLAPVLNYEALIKNFMMNQNNAPLINALNAHKKFRKPPFVLYSSGKPYMDQDYLVPGRDEFPEQLWSHINNMISKKGWFSS